jgi:DNA-binding phage protein
MADSAKKHAKRGSLKLYKTYNFVDKDPIIDKVRTMVQREGVKYSEIAVRSGVTTSTMHNWFDGKTRRPQFATVMAVVHALGYKVVYVKRGGKS